MSAKTIAACHTDRERAAVTARDGVTSLRNYAKSHGMPDLWNHRIVRQLNYVIDRFERETPLVPDEIVERLRKQPHDAPCLAGRRPDEPCLCWIGRAVDFFQAIAQGSRTAADPAAAQAAAAPVAVPSSANNTD